MADLDESNDKALATLEESHEFPTVFMFKVIGSNSPEFMAEVLQIAVTVLGNKVEPDVSTRESAKGKLQAITMRLPVPTAQHVLDVYQALRKVPGVKIMM